MPTQTEPIFEAIQKQLLARKGTLPDVARGSGVPYSTLMKIVGGQNKNPRIKTIQKLADHFQSKAA